MLAACVRHGDARAALNRHYAEEIERSIGLPTVELPFLEGGISGPDDLALLAESLLPEGAS